MSTAARSTVAVVLSPHALPKLYPLAEEPEEEMDLDGQKFKDSGLGDWQGFYDWLRTSSGKVIGVQQWLDEPHVHVGALARCRNVVLPSHQASLLIFFENERAFNTELSNDQDFGSNRLLLGQDAFALTFCAREEM